MRKTIVLVLIAGFVGAGSFAYANNPESAEAAPFVSEAKTNIIKLQQSFSGLVKRTDVGFILEVEDGSHYQLKGVSLDDIVGKNVDITGVVKGGQKTNTIYVVKADIKK